MPVSTCWLLLSLFGAGCASISPSTSYLYGERYHLAKTNTFATTITAVDGHSTLPRSVPVLLDPGRHVITLTTAPVAGFRVSEARELDLLVEPCTRYYIVAERDNRLQQNWRPVIEHTESAGGEACR